MKAILLVALLVGLAAASFTEEQYQDAFTQWMSDFNRVYASHEFFHRFNSFKNNMDFVEKWNAQNSQTVRTYLFVFVVAVLFCRFWVHV